MTTISKCFTPVIGKLIRVTALNSDGTLPTTGTADKQLVTDGFVEVDLTSEIEAGAEIIQKNAQGQLCVNELQPSSFKRFTVDIQFCGVNPFLLTMISGCVVYYNAAGAVVGFAQPEGEITSKFALELFTGVNASKTASGYFLLPLVNGGTLDSLKIDGKDTIDFNIKGAYTMGGNSWGVGKNMVIDGAGTNAVQTVTITGAPTGGTFTLTFNGKTTTAIPYNATAAQVQAALDALDSIGVGNTFEAGGALPGTGVTVTFQNSWGGQPVNAMTATPSLTGGTTPAVVVTQTTPGLIGTGTVLPTAIDPFDHMLCLSSDQPLPTPACSPIPAL